MADNKDIMAGSDVVAPEPAEEKTGVAKQPQGTGYSVDGYKFAARPDYERALKEYESIKYIKANTDFSDTKSVLKLYNRAVENSSFKSAVGVAFMKELRDNIVGSGILEEKLIAPIPVQKIEGSGRMTRDEKDAQIKRYKEAYENADAGRKIRNIIIVFLVVIIAAMLIITYMSRYSVFTYFTDYKSDMENELIDKYEHWQNELDRREAAVKAKEDKLGIKYDGSIDESVPEDNGSESDKTSENKDGAGEDVSGGTSGNADDVKDNGGDDVG